MRRLLAIFLVIGAGAAAAATVAGADDTRTYKLEMYDAFGLVEGAEIKVAGVNAGKITGFEINAEKRALVSVELSGPLAVLGDKTECKSEPQSLIAEYFLDCQPAGEPLEDGATVPKLVTQTVAPDLVANTLRMPYRDRLRLLINEFGTALAGNPENLNQAIRLGAPALQNLHKALRMLARQSRTIKQLNVDSDEIIGKLAERSDDVVAFVREAGEAATASAERRDDLSTDFDLLDDALRELGPTMAALKNAARQSAPLLTDLRGAAPGLTTLATNLPAFAGATERSLVSLGRAAEPGISALRRGADEIEALAEAGGNANPVAKQAQRFFTDISDPRRAVSIDERVTADTGRDNPRPGSRDTRGYTGMEGLLNYFYYFAGAINQFDEAGHFLHFSLYDVDEGPCGAWNAQQDWPVKPGGRDPDGDGRTTNLLQADPCVSGLGPNQPGITPGEQEEDLGIGPYHPSVCPEGSNDLELCNPNGAARAPSRQSRGDSESTSRNDVGRRPAASGGGGNRGDVREQLEDILDLPGKALDDLGLNGALESKGGKRGGRAGIKQGADEAAEDLLDFLFRP